MLTSSMGTDLASFYCQIKEETCAAQPGKEARCSLYDGDLTLKVPLIKSGKYELSYDFKRLSKSTATVQIIDKCSRIHLEACRPKEKGG